MTLTLGRSTISEKAVSNVVQRIGSTSNFPKILSVNAIRSAIARPKTDAGKTRRQTSLYSPKLSNPLGGQGSNTPQSV